MKTNLYLSLCLIVLLLGIGLAFKRRLIELKQTVDRTNTQLTTLTKELNDYETAN